MSILVDVRDSKMSGQDQNSLSLADAPMIAPFHGTLCRVCVGRQTERREGRTDFDVHCPRRSGANSRDIR